MPNVTISKETMNIVDWLVETKIESSKRQAREDVTNGAISINGEKIKDITTEISADLSIEEKFIIVRKGKKNYTLINLV